MQAIQAKVVWNEKYNMYDGKVAGKVVSRAKSARAVVRTLMNKYEENSIGASDGKIRAEVMRAKKEFKRK